MESIKPSGTIKDLIGEINLLRNHITGYRQAVPTQIQDEIAKVKFDVIGALDSYHADEKDRQYLEKCFLQLGELQNTMSELRTANDDQSGISSSVNKLDRTCCNIQIYLSELELPKLTSG